MATHGVAVFVGVAITVASGLMLPRQGGSTPIEGKACPAGRVNVELSPVRRPLEPPCREQSSSKPAIGPWNGHNVLLEVQKSQAEAALAELGGMPLTWDSIAEIPEGLRPERFEALVRGVAIDLELAEPEIDCSEIPCVALAPSEWTDEELTAARERVRAQAEIEEPTLFVLDVEGRVFGIYSERHQPSGMLERIWFRLMQNRRDEEG